MIDPVGTGLSHAVGEAKDKDFWGVDPDIESVSRFIRQYVSDNGRWNSPKYLLGRELRHDARAGRRRPPAGQGQWRSTASSWCRWRSISRRSSALRATTRPYPLFLPTFAATAYHKTLPQQPANLEAFLTRCAWSRRRVRECAAGGRHAERMPRAAVVEKLHDYTGLSDDYIHKANLRVSEPFTQELLRRKAPRSAVSTRASPASRSTCSPRRRSTIRSPRRSAPPSPRPSSTTTTRSSSSGRARPTTSRRRGPPRLGLQAPGPGRRFRCRWPTPARTSRRPWASTRTCRSWC